MPQALQMRKKYQARGTHLTKGLALFLGIYFGSFWDKAVMRCISMSGSSPPSSFARNLALGRPQTQNHERFQPDFEGSLQNRTVDCERKARGSFFIKSSALGTCSMTSCASAPNLLLPSAHTKVYTTLLLLVYP